MKKCNSRKRRAGVSALLFALMLTGLTACGRTSGTQPESETDYPVYVFEKETENGQTVSGQDPAQTESAQEEPPLELVPEPEQVEGRDYQLDVPVMALEVGTDETNIKAVWEHTYTDGEVIRIWNAAKPEEYTDFPGTLQTSRDGKVKNYEAQITGLQPETQYAYKAGRGEEWTKTYFFVTKPAVTDFQFLAATDVQIGVNDSAADGELWNKTINQMVEQTGSVNFMLHMGDSVNSGGNKLQFDLFMKPEPLKEIPVANVVGNHDNDSQYYAQYFRMPNLDASGRGMTPDIGEESADYSFTYGDTLFLCLNTNNTDNQAHIAFMSDTINQYTQKNGGRPRWIIAAMHHSIFSITDHMEKSNYEERKQALAPAFSQLGVDVVLMGHDHSYARTHLMDGTTPEVIKNDDGSRPTTLQARDGQVMYFTLNSASGSKFYEQVDIGEMIAFNNQENKPNLTKVLVRQDRIVFTTCRVEENSTVVEEFTLLHK